MLEAGSDWEKDGPQVNVPSPHTKPKEVILNPLMARIQMPGETFTLPSGGIFYAEDELRSDVVNAEIHVYPMTAIDEITIKTPDLLFSGEAAKQVFARCIPQITNISKMLAKDVDFLLICLRKVSYGDDIRIQFTHDCKNAKENTYTADVGKFIRTSKRIDPTTFVTEFTVIMPNGQKVLLQPLRFDAFIKIMQSEDEGGKTPEELRDDMADSLSGIISNVDEIDDSSMIIEWLKGVKPTFIELINDHVSTTLDWGPEFGTKTKCKDCNKNIEVIAPMNPLSFFT